MQGAHLYFERRSKAWGLGEGEGGEPVLSACSISYVFTIQNL